MANNTPSDFTNSNTSSASVRAVDFQGQSKTSSCFFQPLNAGSLNAATIIGDMNAWRDLLIANSKCNIVYERYNIGTSSSNDVPSSITTADNAKFLTVNFQGNPDESGHPDNRGRLIIPSPIDTILLASAANPVIPLSDPAVADIVAFVLATVRNNQGERVRPTSIVMT